MSVENDDIESDGSGPDYIYLQEFEDEYEF